MQRISRVGGGAACVGTEYVGREAVLGGDGDGGGGDGDVNADGNCDSGCGERENSGEN